MYSKSLVPINSFIKEIERMESFDWLDETHTLHYDVQTMVEKMQLWLPFKTVGSGEMHFIQVYISSTHCWSRFDIFDAEKALIKCLPLNYIPLYPFAFSEVISFTLAQETLIASPRALAM